MSRAAPSIRLQPSGCGADSFPDASRYGSPTTPGTVPAIPLTRNAVTFVFCHLTWSSRGTTAIFVSNSMS